MIRAELGAVARAVRTPGDSRVEWPRNCIEKATCRIYAEDAPETPGAASGISLVVRVEYRPRVLVGREAELRRVTALLDEARRGRSSILVVVGDAGLGKTALLEEGRALATDMRVLGSIGVESESEIPFASLHALFRPMLDLLPRIPTVQARALAAALALEEGEPDVLTVGAGTLSLLVEATAESPVLVAVDDAHWLDRASAEALAFAARRLIGEEFAMLATLRPDPGTPVRCVSTARARTARRRRCTASAATAQRARSRRGRSTAACGGGGQPPRAAGAAGRAGA